MIAVSSPTLQFLAFGLFSFACLSGGYTARRRGWLNEEASRPIHLHTVVWVWSLACLLSLWRIPPRTENLWLLVIQPLLMIFGACAVIPVAKVIGCTKKEIGTMALAAGMSNNGFTLGAYLCYSVLDPSNEALAYASALVTATTLSVVVIFYPVARYYSGVPSKHESTVRIVSGYFLDLRTTPLYAALTGVALAICQAPYPEFIEHWYVLDALVYICGFGGYFGIGLRLRLNHSLKYVKHHVLLAIIKFVALPLIAAILLSVIDLTPSPLGAIGRRVVQIEAATPVAIMTVMLANLFHLDVRMASVIWVWNTLFFVALPLPVILYWAA